MLGAFIKRRNSRRTPIAAPDDRAELVRLFPDASVEEIELIQRSRDYTMTSPERIIGLVRAIDYLIANRIPGDIVECGVWRGGSMFVAAKACMSRGDSTRRLWLYDTFDGMTAPSSVDVDLRGRTAVAQLNTDDPEDRNGVWCVSRLDQVRQTMQSSGYPADKVRFVVGPVEETLTAARPGEIALLRLDTDWYESTKCELEHLFPLLVPGGVLIIDDYGHWHGCRNAVDEYFAHNDIPIHLARMDYTGRIGIKPTLPRSHNSR